MKTNVQPQSDRAQPGSPSAHGSARQALNAHIHNSPRMVAQRQQLERAFGLPVQRQGLEEEELQMKAAPGVLQRQGPEEEEELLQGKFALIQRQGPEEEEGLLQGIFPLVQRQGGPEEEELLQGKFANRADPAKLERDSDLPENRTGMPDQLKTGIEALSVLDMSDVRVHYESDRPARLNALAYTQGTDFHVAHGQEKHLPHEAWHVVQQAQGRVRPAMKMKDGVTVDNDERLEDEADVMGAKDLQVSRRAPVVISSATRTMVVQQTGKQTEASKAPGVSIGTNGEKVRLSCLSTTGVPDSVHTEAEATAHHHVPDHDRASSPASLAGDVLRSLQRQMASRAPARLIRAEAGPEVGGSGLGSAPPQAVQRKDLTRGKLNIAGENHAESGLRRDDEKAYAAERTGGEYWTEGEFTVKPGIFATARHGDPFMLRAEMLLAILKEKSVPNFIVPFVRGQIPAGWPQDKDAGTLWKAYRDVLQKQVVEIAFALALASHDPAESDEAEKARQTHGALEALGAKIAKTDVGGVQEIATEANKVVEMFAKDVLNSGDIRSETDIHDLRSKAMHGAASEEAARWILGKTGLWKVGQSHIDEMRAVKGGASYEIMTKDQFNDDFVPWQSARI